MLLEWLKITLLYIAVTTATVGVMWVASAIDGTMWGLPYFVGVVLLPSVAVVYCLHFRDFWTRK